MTLFSPEKNSMIIDTNPIKHNISASPTHWQLRDMIKSHPNGILYCNRDSIHIYDPKSYSTKTIYSNLNFHPTHLACHDGLIAVVGSTGQLLVIKESVYRADIGKSINNSVQIYGSPPKICVCSNDGTIKIIDGTCLKLIQTINHQYPINNCAISPDGKKLVAVGDTPNLYEYYFEDGFVAHDAKKSSMDAGFCVSWNNLSDQFAVSTQDGYACIWDVRKNEILHKINSHQRPSAKGAVRIVRYSRTNNTDLLLFTEHANVFNIIDARSFQNRQVIDFSANSSSDVLLSGALFGDEGDNVFVSSNNRVHEYKINMVCRRQSNTFDFL